MQEVGEDLGAVDDARTGPVEEGRTRPGCARPGCRPSPANRSAAVVPPRSAPHGKPQGISSSTSGRASTTVSHVIGRVCSPAAASSGTPPAASICSGTQWPHGPQRVEPFDGRHPRPRSSRDAVPDRRHAFPEKTSLGSRAFGYTQHLAERGQAAEDAVERSRFEADHPRVAVHRAHGFRHLPVGDRADVAEVLREHDVGFGRREEPGVQGVQGRTAMLAADGHRYLPARQQVVVDRAARDHRDAVERAGWPVAFVGPARQRRQEPESRDEVGRGGEQRDDPHPSTVGDWSILHICAEQMRESALTEH